MFDRIKARRRAKELERANNDEAGVSQIEVEPKGLLEKIGINLLVKLLTVILNFLKKSK